MTERRSADEEILTVREVAARLKVHIYTVHDLLRTGQLKGFKLRRRWRIRIGSLNSFVTKHERDNK